MDILGLKGRGFLLVIVAGLILLAVSCGQASQPVQGNIAIDPQFDKLASKLGNEVYPALTYLFEVDGVKYQYSRAVLFKKDSQGLLGNKVTLEPLGNYLGVTRPPEAQSVDPGALYVNGHEIWSEIIPIYHRYGEALVGKPLTGLLYNSIEKRFEQYFENMGFYRNETDPPGKIHLLPYGDWVCLSNCYHTPDAGNISVKQPDPPSDEYLQRIDDLFMRIATRIGLNFTGNPLTSTRIAEDGLLEKVFENLVMVVDPKDEVHYSLRPLFQTLDLPLGPMVQRDEDVSGFFFQMDGDMGYHIPSYFMPFITQHGTIEFFGYPIEEPTTLADGTIQQCFLYQCILYQPNAPEDLRIRLMATGTLYIRSQTLASKGAYSLQVWERYSLLPPGENQEIGLAVFDGSMNPVSNINSFVIIDLPDGSSLRYDLPQTGTDGMSSVVLDPILAPNGSLIAYRVCTVELTGHPFCTQESFLIWKTR